MKIESKEDAQAAIDAVCNWLKIASLSTFEITPEMVEAGYRVLKESGRLEHHMPGVDRDLVTEIFSAMLAQESAGRDPDAPAADRARAWARERRKKT